MSELSSVIGLKHAVAEIKDACDFNIKKEKRSPFFFLVGAGISYPPVPLSAQIIEHCQAHASRHGPIDEPTNLSSMARYSFWFERAYRQPEHRRDYLSSLINGKQISRANFRLAHLLLGEDGHTPVTDLVVTPNFDDFLARALRIFGKSHIVCDHPATTTRLAAVEPGELKILHVHGTFSFYDAKNLGGEIGKAANPSLESVGTMAAFLDHVMMERSPIVVGYGGWEEDVLMRALKRRLAGAGLPINMYWFCRSRSQLDAMPQWLREHNDVRFVVPEAPPPGQASVRERSRSSPEGMAAQPVPAGAAEAAQSAEKDSLDAYAIFDTFNRVFGFPTPRLTREPLAFLAQQLRATLPTEDLLGGDADIYGLGRVVEQIDLAAKSSDAAPHTVTDTTAGAMEAMREAIRRSDYAGALVAAQPIDISAVPGSTAEELLSLFVSIASGLNDDSEQELLAYDLGLRAASYAAAPGRTDSEVAWILICKAIVLRRHGRHEEAIAVYDELISQFGESSDSTLRDWLAQALVGKGLTLGELQRSEEEIAVYNQVVSRFGDAPEPALRDQVANALLYKGITFGELDRYQEAIAIYDELVARFGEAREPALRERVGSALHNKAYSLGQLERSDEEIAVYDEIISRFGDAAEPKLRVLVATVLRGKGYTLAQLDRIEEAIAIYDELLGRFGAAPEAAVREQVAMALVNKGFALGRLERSEEAIAVYDQVRSVFGTSPEPALQEQVANALFNKGGRLGTLNRVEESIAVFDELISRFAEASAPELRKHVARALVNRGFALQELNRYEEAITDYDRVLSRYGDSADSALLVELATAMIEKGSALEALDRTAEAAAVYQQLIARFGEASEPTLREFVERARRGQRSAADQPTRRKKTGGE